MSKTSISKTTNSNDDDYLLRIKILNNRIFRLMKQKNIHTVSELSRQTGIGVSALADLLNMRVSPFSAGEIDWRPSVLKLSEFLGILPEEMFNHQQLTEPLPTNKAERSINLDKVTKMLNTQQQEYLPDLDIEREERDKLLYEVLETLTPRERVILELRFGLKGDPCTLEEVGKAFKVDKERIRQIEAKALRKMRHPSRTEILKEYT